MGLDDKNRPLYMISIAAELDLQSRLDEREEEVEDLHARVRRLADRVRELETRTPVGAIVRVTPTRRLP